MAAPGRRTPDNLLGCIRNIGRGINECRILSAEFEKDGGQIFCGCLHNDLAHLDAPSEEDEIKWQLEEFGDFITASRNGGHGPRVEVFRYEIQQEFACGRQAL